MVYQLETAIARRTVLKGAGLVALCSVAVPLQALVQSKFSTSIFKGNSSQIDMETQRSATSHQKVKCPNCNSSHGMGDIHLKLNDRCQSCGGSLSG
jgi:anaerobic selenocysteine-containing dehydrogenase